MTFAHDFRLDCIICIVLNSHVIFPLLLAKATSMMHSPVTGTTTHQWLLSTSPCMKHIIILQTKVWFPLGNRGVVLDWKGTKTAAAAIFGSKRRIRIAFIWNESATAMVHGFTTAVVLELLRGHSTNQLSYTITAGYLILTYQTRLFISTFLQLLETKAMQNNVNILLLHIM